MRLNRFVLTTSRFQSNSAPGDGEITLPSPENTAATFPCLGDGTSVESEKRAYNTAATAGYNVVINNDRTVATLSSDPSGDDNGIWMDIITIEKGEYEG